MAILETEVTKKEEDHYPKKEAPGRKRGGRTCERKRGGHLPEAFKEEEKHPGKPKAHHVARKHGGKVDGKMAERRPDRRARGGGLADLHPETTAGKMEEPGYERHEKQDDEGGRGKDRD